ncbi:MAG: type II CAAX endopeptidase family protein [Thalassolituus sp.]|uniref:CPBP family intramembrane glutamic endopeptidase n=1 Tax=Thalassolituus sp. TaxID=2030822 RepID=UPI0039828273
MKDISSKKDKQRLAWLERAEDDFPFYNGEPVTLSVGQWLFVMVAVALGFACLTVDVPVLTSEVGLFIRTLLFFVIPLGALRLVAGPHWTCLFRRLRFADIGWMISIAVLNLIVTILLGSFIMKFFGAESNAAIHTLGGMGTTEQGQFFVRTVPQLFGEEVLTVLPFLAVLHIAHARFALSRTAAVLVAWLLSSVIFGLVHLPSYNWNLLQCLVVIGSARVILTVAYIKTKNIWVSTGAHIINDWTIFGIVILGANLA